jgi:hypothetical protein
MGDASESKNEEGAFTHSYSHRSIQREAALTKFRLKRKERCYEKKVCCHLHLSSSPLLQQHSNTISIDYCLVTVTK